MRRTPAQKDTAAIRARATNKQQAYMKILKPVLFVISLFGLGIANAQSLNFVNKADMPTARAGSSGAYYFGNEYIANGFSGTTAYTSQIEKYNFVNNSWSTLNTSIPTIAKRYGNSTIIAGTMYLYNGITPTGLNNKLEVIELDTGNVSVSPTLNPNPVYNAGSATYGDYMLSFGGCINAWSGAYSNKLYRIAPWGEWTELASMPEALETKGVVYYGSSPNPKLYAFGGYKEDVDLREDFQDITTGINLSIANWINVAQTGTKKYGASYFGTEKFAAMTAYAPTVVEQEPSNIAWLISPNIEVTSADDAYLTFQTIDAYDNGATLEAYVITNWTGDITTSSKTLLNAVISSGHTTGFGPYYIDSGEISLAAAPTNFRIAFKYTGGYTPLKTTTYQIDNIRIHRKRKSNNIYVYDINANTWSIAGATMPQALSAHSVTFDSPFEDGEIYITGDYENQTFLGMFTPENGNFTAINQTNMIGRRHHTAEVFENELYLFGGNTTPDTFSSLASTQSANLATLATAQFESQNSISFYPNPATDKITLKATIESVSLYTFEGKKIDVSIQNNEIDLSHLNHGVYLLQGTYKDGSQFSDKLIKH